MYTSLKVLDYFQKAGNNHRICTPCYVMNQVILRAIFEFTIELQFTKENDDNSFVYHVEGNSLKEQKTQLDSTACCVLKLLS